MNGPHRTTHSQKKLCAVWCAAEKIAAAWEEHDAVVFRFGWFEAWCKRLDDDMSWMQTVAVFIWFVATRYFRTNFFLFYRFFWFRCFSGFPACFLQLMNVSSSLQWQSLGVQSPPCVVNGTFHVLSNPFQHIQWHRSHMPRSSLY